MGVCRKVYLGGHVQTGGYGQLIRSFGLLADYVQKVRIITADGQARWVERGRAQDKDILYAILGGSPGNFGVITDVTLNVLKDEDYPAWFSSTVSLQWSHSQAPVGCHGRFGRYARYSSRLRLLYFNDERTAVRRETSCDRGISPLG